MTLGHSLSVLTIVLLGGKIEIVSSMCQERVNEMIIQVKMALLVLICFFIADNAIAELTPNDLEEIRKIVEKVVDERIAESEKRIIERTDLKLDKVQAEINGLRWGLGLVGAFLIGQIALIIYALSQTSKEVEKVREYRDDVVKVVDEAIRIVEESGENLRNAKETFETFMQSTNDFQQAVKQFKEYIESQSES
jgi:hypothetical protein